MNRRIHLILIALAATLLMACDNSHFKVDGEIANLDGGTVKVIFHGDSDVVDEKVNLDKNGHFTFTGAATQPALVSILDNKGESVATVVAVNGDHLKLKGDASKPMGIKVKGNKLNEEWQLFRDEHAAFYTDPNPGRLNAAIEKYVREHPDDLLSTVLLVADYCDYSDRDKVDKMLKSINTKVRPESLTQAFTGNKPSAGKKNLPRLMTLNLWKHGGGFEEIKLTDRVVILALWANPQPNRQELTTKMRDIIESSDPAISVIDILAESDTLKWHKTIAGEDWPHYWAPGGPLEQGIQLLGITTMPWFAVTDSTGMVVYSGPNFDEAKKSALDNIKPKTRD